MTPEEIIKVLREVDADAKASEGDYYADQFAWHGAGEIADAVEQMAAEIARLREERRWIPVGERLPDGDEEWVDIAGEWGDCVGWYDTVEWHNVLDDRCPGEVTHWKKRAPAPEANG